MFIRKRELVRKIDRLEGTIEFLLSEDRALFSRLEALENRVDSNREFTRGWVETLFKRVDVLEAAKDEVDEATKKTEELFQAGFENIMNYGLDQIKKAGESLGG